MRDAAVAMVLGNTRLMRACVGVLPKQLFSRILASGRGLSSALVCVRCREEHASNHAS
jgi:hypothetical protein